MLTKLKEKLISFREYFCRGGFNIPTERQINEAPLVLPESKTKLAISEAKIDAASNSSVIKCEIVTGGIRGWLRGDFNLPTQKDIDSPNFKLPKKFQLKLMIENLLSKIKPV